MNKKLFGHYFKYLKEDHVKKALIEEMKQHHFPNEVYALFDEAWDSRFWDTYGFDGKTILKDKYVPRLASFLHDYMSRTGRGGYVSDFIFRWLEIQTGTKPNYAQFQFVSVRVGSQFLTLRDILKGNRKKETKAMHDLYNYIKSLD